ncbi:MAG: GGDEF domain-containing response regulator [Rhodospirillales bacterium]|nr:GGDEF domain-containing response regulator [Rhodospirillales bacterium]
MIEDKEALKFLIVEDDPDYALYLYELVHACFGSSDITVAQNTSETFAAMAKQDFDVCFLDYFLDSETGLDVLQNADTVARPTAFILLTSLVDRKVAVEALRLGAMDYLVKGSFDRFDLERSVTYAVYRRRKEMDLLREALRDPLTGLGNRELFIEQARLLREQAQRDGSLFAIVYMDIDDFKPVNDTFGHHVGDELLKRIAKRVTERLRGSDAVARVGGDEFIVLLSKVRNAESVATVSDELALAISQPYVIDGKTIEIGVSIGVALYPTDSDSIDHLTRLADARMYEGKNSLRGKDRAAT